MRAALWRGRWLGAMIRIIGSVRMPSFRAALAFTCALATSAMAQAAPVERPVDVDAGVRLSVLTAGAPSDTPAVALVTGWRVTKDAWRPQLDALSVDRQVIAF